MHSFVVERKFELVRTVAQTLATSFFVKCAPQQNVIHGVP